MSYLTRGVEILFKIFLFILLAAMVYEQLKTYIKNDDVSSLLYKKYKHHKEDVYPTFSVCVVLYDGGIFKHELGDSSWPYWNFVRGLGEDGAREKFSNIEYDDVVVDVRKMILKYKRKSRGMDGKTKNLEVLDFESVFRISYQNPNRVCFTKKNFKEEMDLIKYDLVKLNYKWLTWKNSECHIYVHHKGQLIRSLTKPAVILFGKQLARGKLDGERGFNYILRMRNNIVEVLRKRPDANEKCDISLTNDDQKWHEVLINKHQCIPVFMKRFLQNCSQQNQLPECNINQHRQVVFDYSPYDDFEATGKLYLPPCSEMSNVITINEDIARFDDRNITNLILKFEYSSNYRETINRRNFNVYDLWSQIGGIVGIIIGYSMSQIPETLQNLRAKAKYLLKPMQRNQYNVK